MATAPHWTMRTANPGDAGVVSDLVCAAYARWVPVLGRKPAPMLVDYSQALESHRFDLLEDRETLVALIETERREDHIWIENLAVRPSSQRQGLGRDLLAHAEWLAREAGLEEVRPLTNGRMTSNRALYARLGYFETHEEPYKESSVVYMTKLLR